MKVRHHDVQANPSQVYRYKKIHVTFEAIISIGIQDSILIVNIFIVNLSVTLQSSVSSSVVRPFCPFNFINVSSSHITFLVTTHAEDCIMNISIVNMHERIEQFISTSCFTS